MRKQTTGRITGDTTTTAQSTFFSITNRRTRKKDAVKAQEKSHQGTHRLIELFMKQAVS
jgi:hypothetical protein